MKNVCAKCGNLLIEGAAFCGYCGQAVKTDVAKTRPTQQAAPKRAPAKKKSAAKNGGNLNKKSPTKASWSSDDWLWLLIPLGALLMKWLFGDF